MMITTMVSVDATEFDTDDLLAVLRERDVPCGMSDTEFFGRCRQLLATGREADALSLLRTEIADRLGCIV